MEILLSPEKNHQFNVPQLKKIKEILFEKKTQAAQNMSYRYRVPAACYRVQGKPIRVLFQETFARIGPRVIKKNMALFLVGIHEDKLDDRSEDLQQHAVVFFQPLDRFAIIFFVV